MSSIETGQREFLEDAFDEKGRLRQEVRAISYDSELDGRLYLRAAIIQAGLAKATLERAKGHKNPSLDIHKLVADDKITVHTDHPTWGEWVVSVEDPAESKVVLAFGESETVAYISYLFVGEPLVIGRGEDEVDCGKVIGLEVNDEPVAEQHFI